LTGKADVAPSCKTCGESQGLLDVLFLKVREIGQQAGNCAAGGDGFYDHCDGNAHPPDAGLAAHHLWFDGDSLEFLHVVMIAQRGHMSPA
jgi:hypothetical protein